MPVKVTKMLVSFLQWRLWSMRKTLETYMNDPDIINEPMPLREVHAIRLMIHDETKNMTPEEHTAHVSKNSQILLDRYGISLRTVEAHP
jgi:hypothetical protein